MTWPPHPHGNRAPAPSGPTLPVAGLWLWNNNNKKVSVGTRWTGQTPNYGGTSLPRGTSPYLGHHDGRVEIPAPGDTEAPGRWPHNVHRQRHT